MNSFLKLKMSQNYYGHINWKCININVVRRSDDKASLAVKINKCFEKSGIKH